MVLAEYLGRLAGTVKTAAPPNPLGLLRSAAGSAGRGLRTAAKYGGPTLAGTSLAAAGGVRAYQNHNQYGSGNADPVHRYTQNTVQAETLAQPLYSQMQTAMQQGDMAQVQKLHQQLQSGDFGGSMWSFGGLNPFAQAPASYYMQNAREAAQAAQQHHQSLGGQVNPEYAQAQLQYLIGERAKGGLLAGHRRQVDQRIRELQAYVQHGQEPPAAQEYRQRLERHGLFSPGELGGMAAAPTPGGSAVAERRMPAPDMSAIQPYDYQGPGR